MDARELRIGNLILYDNGIGIWPGEVKEILKNAVRLHFLEPVNIGGGGVMYWDNTELNIVQPIPLTPEWLERFGFEKFTMPLTSKVNYEDYRLGNMVVIQTKDGFEIEYSGLEIEDRTYLTRKNYVHELQNAFYILTGKELELK